MVNYYLINDYKITCFGHSVSSQVATTRRQDPQAVCFHISLRNRKCYLPLQSHLNSCITRKPSFLKGSSSSSPMSHFFLSPFLLTAPRGGVGDSESQDGKWGSWNGEVERQETPKRVARSNCLSPDLQMPWLQARRENPLWISLCSLEKHLSSNLMF